MSLLLGGSGTDAIEPQYWPSCCHKNGSCMTSANCSGLQDAVRTHQSWMEASPKGSIPLPVHPSSPNTRLVLRAAGGQMLTPTKWVSEVPGAALFKLLHKCLFHPHDGRIPAGEGPYCRRRRWNGEGNSWLEVQSDRWPTLDQRSTGFTIIWGHEMPDFLHD